MSLDGSRQNSVESGARSWEGARVPTVALGTGMASKHLGVIPLSIFFVITMGQ